jgi:Zn-dependent protease
MPASGGFFAPLPVRKRPSLSNTELIMTPVAANTIHQFSVWLLPVLIAITFHEGAHALVARLRGDDTAWQLGRVTLNPLKHIDPFGTVLLPGMLLLMRAPFLFGYAKPVPVNERKLYHPRIDGMLVAAAGPVMNLLLALAAALALHVVDYAPPTAGEWLEENLDNAILLNVGLALFNLIPLPPLDGGRILTGLLPRPLAIPFSRLQSSGMLILIGLLLLLPLLGRQLGLNLDILSWLLVRGANAIIGVIMTVTGNA